MGVWLVDFQECLLSGRGWRRKELKRNACKFNDIAGTLEAFQHSDTHRQRNHNCSGEISPCQSCDFIRSLIISKVSLEAQLLESSHCQGVSASF